MPARQKYPNSEKRRKKMNLDPNVWFKNVEIVAAKRIGRETVQYVSNIFKYYVAYKLTAGKSGF
jgi:membrane-bound lytic murein transglycosylase MltF